MLASAISSATWYYVGNRTGGDPMDKFVARANIEHFRRKLAAETDETKRQALVRLLAEEEAKLASLTNDPQKKPPQDA
jgi:hypothetical protein